MASSAGVVLERTLQDYHFGDVERIVDRLMREHEADGCEYAGGREAARKLVMAEYLAHSRCFLAGLLEDKRIEVYCPHRDGVKEAA
jgi:hypothetical protein